ncbi:hypothetical protein B0H34DRAFT_542878 [Crassisporium funariophilum]|nr:hypothetical protein B0H34DRAFT_542878 [Crassisporium funariophilum]
MSSGEPISLSKVEDPASINWERYNFRDGLEEDDELWMQYLHIASEFDKRMIDDLTRIVDTMLVYVALFISILTAFIIETSKTFQRDPTEINSDLLVAIYTQLSNPSAPVIDPQSFFTLNAEQRYNALYANSLLYTSLAISIVVSVAASAAKLWLIRYNREVTAPGPPFQRAMKRQEAYNGVVAWKLEEIIESLPVMVVFAVVLFGIYIHSAIAQDQQTLGYVIGTILLLALAFIIVTSLSGAYIPTSPFQSSFSDFIQFMFKIIPDWKLTPNEKSPGVFRTFLVTLTSIAMAVVTALLVRWRHTAVYQGLFFVPIACTFVLMRQPTKKDTMKPRRFGLPEWVLFSTITVFATLAISAYISPHAGPFIVTFCVASVLLALQGYYGILLSEFVPNTAQAEAVSWMLKTSSSQDATWFRKAGEIAGSSEITRAVLLENLLPLLSPLITSIPHEDSHASQHSEQEAYVTCLARLCQFSFSKGSLWRNEITLRHPIFPTELSRRLMMLRDCSRCNARVRDAAKVALESCAYHFQDHLQLSKEVEKGDEPDA